MRLKICPCCKKDTPYTLDLGSKTKIYKEPEACKHCGYSFLERKIKLQNKEKERFFKLYRPFFKKATHCTDLFLSALTVVCFVSASHVQSKVFFVILTGLGVMSFILLAASFCCCFFHQNNKACDQHWGILFFYKRKWRQFKEQNRLEDEKFAAMGFVSE